MTDRSTAPPYSEEQATAWLAWLAYHMHRRDLTIFQIENLQPDWLAGRKERAPHLLLTRTLWGVWAGLVGGLIGGLIVGVFTGLWWGALASELASVLSVGPVAGLIVGPIIGLVIGLIDLTVPMHKFDGRLRAHGNRTKSLFAGTIGFGLVYTLILVLFFGLLNAEQFGLLFGLSGMVILGFVRTSRVALRDADGLIRTVESLRWSWRHARQNATKGLIFGLLIGLLFVLLFVVSGMVILVIFGGPYVWLLGVLIFMLSSMLLFGLIGGLIGGFQPGAQELKARPNQGIWLTRRSAVKIGIPAGFISGGLLGLLSQNITAGLVSGGATFLIIGGWSGGLDAIEHSIVRLILAWRGHAPLNYARFLDDAAEKLNFLQKVGGGYVFIHRYLLEHFAEIAVEKGYVIPMTEN